MNRCLQQQMTFGFAGLMWLVSGLVIGTGCNAQRGLPVSGEVRFEGQPVEVGQISFQPSTQASGIGVAADIHNGVFELSESDALPPGKYRVHITAMRARERNTHDLSFAGMSLDLPVQYIPTKFNERTGLEVEVSTGSPNHFEFDLE